MCLYYESLLKKIEDRTAVLGVVGLGYVGLPLAAAMAGAGYRVLGFDVQQSRARQVMEGESYVEDLTGEELSGLVREGRLCASSDFSALDRCDCVAICVPTPLDCHGQPDLSHVTASAAEVSRHAHPGMLVVLESTTYPGTTEEVVAPLLERGGLRIGREVFLAFSPERVDPGNPNYHTGNTPKVAGGVTMRCTELTVCLYEKILDAKVHRVSSPRVAEMEKILENAFRSINIALANEMAMVCDRMEIPVWEVIEAAATKPYGFMPFYPGPGLGGHCIPIDPFYLTWKAREYGCQLRLIETAGAINDRMPEYTADRIARLLNTWEKPVKGAKILVLGAAYKAGVGDLRQSPALRVIEILEARGAQVRVHDPHAEVIPIHGREEPTVPLTEEALEQADLVAILTAHPEFDPAEIMAHAKLVFDGRNLGGSLLHPNWVRL